MRSNNYFGLKLQTWLSYMQDFIVMSTVKRAIKNSSRTVQMLHVVRQVCIWAKWLIPVSVARSDQEYFYSPLDGMLVHRRFPLNSKCLTILYTWVERGTVRVKCLTQEHNTKSLARAPTRTARSGDELTNHEATEPPYMLFVMNSSLFISRTRERCHS